ncbi:kinase-like domain-containing protein [Suillus subalutaceus]|uniref:kinase-like domain-containing protein n=1 Tax=Suillus subalutaceus TaxID=48586 RepID=UPI001B85CCDB|nr:kinase-like domain-containing protein [Suillus subalutaceus]KAG1854794.1 kinase-like domain-containing protein [Suillus subalutaceus]
MTNASAGSKRSWEGHAAESHSHKRHRDEPRDWRDVHLKSPTDKRSKSNSSRRDSIDKREPGRSREDPRRPSDHSRDWDRDKDRRDGRDRDRDRERDRDRDREHRRREDDRKDEHRRRTPPRNRRSPAPSNGHSHQAKDYSDKEEGELLIFRSRHNLLLPPQPDPELDLEIDTAAAEAAARAARRARRQAILARHSGIASANKSVSPSPGPSSAVQPQPVASVSDTPQPHSAVDTSASSTADISKARHDSISKRDSASPQPDDSIFELAKDEDDEDVRAKMQDGAPDQISAADYDPSLDRREDEQRRVLKDEPMNVETIEEEEEEEEEEEDDVDDMFAAAVTEKKRKKVKKVVKKAAPALITTTLDSASDHEGYYQVILGEQLDGGRYQVFSSLGKGMFANVVRARVLQDAEINKEVAIKIIRSQESMHRAGLKEVQILNKLKQADPEDKKHIVRLERTFEHRGHLCLVFESMSMNLRDVVKRFGKDVGLNIKAVRAYAHQLFLALSLLKKVNIMHADIKPDNILVNEQKTLLKLCDLGSASDASENDITPYLVSRFYRAPEIILGVPYDPALDIWSIGCTLYELYTGKILFPGRSNNQMLLLMMELKGRFNTKMIKKAKFGEMYFDEMGGFESVETDRVTGANVVRKVHISKPSRDLRARLMPPASVKMKDDEMKLLTSFIDLLDKCMALDPARRITPKEALIHPFIRG